MSSVLKNCNDNHGLVYYPSNECPVCVERMRVTELVDGKEDIDQENIQTIFNSLEQLTRVVEKLQQNQLNVQRSVSTNPSLKDIITQVFRRKP